MNYQLVRKKRAIKSLPKFKFLLSVLMVFTVLYQPPMKISIIYVISLISIIYILFERRLKYSDIQILLLFLMCFCYLFLIVVLNNTEKANISYFFWIIFAIIPAAIAIRDYTSKAFEKYCKEQKITYFSVFFHIILCAAIIQSALAYLSFFNIGIQEFFNAQMLTNNLYTQAHIMKWGYRIYGYGISLMYAIPIIQSVISAWSIIWGIQKKKIQYTIIGILILISAVINAKISILVFLAVLISSILINRKHFVNNTLKIVFILLILYIISQKIILFIEDYNKNLYDWLSILKSSNLISEYYIDYYTDFSKLVLPDGLAGIFGTGNPRTATADVDMGFMNDIWIGGIPYIMFIMGIILKLCRRIYRNFKYNESWNYIVSISLLITFLIAYTKGTAFSYSSFMALFMLMALL